MRSGQRYPAAASHELQLALGLNTSAPTQCGYLPQQASAVDFILSEAVDTAVYQRLIDAGFRRSGVVFYRPRCPACRACRSLRVPAAEFRPTRSQRRVWRRNADVELSIVAPRCDAEHRALLQDYQARVHDELSAERLADLMETLCTSSVTTIEMSYRLDGRLVGVGIVDVCPDGLSSVYFYYDPALARRSLGVYSVLCEIEECRRRGLPYWYAGYYVAGSAKMSYKVHYRPYELLDDDGAWLRPAETNAR
jgi:arginyl-tRNA--protein-N-Asp/Glu arginylyltransferase